MELTAVSLFAGVGGFDLAMERLGINVVAHCEIDKHAKSVLSRHFPNATQFTDVKEVTGEQLKSAGFVPSRGIITGGFPCQDLSVAGKRLGFTGQRSSLFYEIARIADETKAEWLVLENVPGLLTSQRGADMGAVVGTLVELGYCLSWRVLDAKEFGVPQRRRRVFIVARRTGDPTSPAKVLFERTSVRGDFETGRASGQKIAGSAGTGVAEPIAFSHTQINVHPSEDVFPTLRTEGRGQAVMDPVSFTSSNYSQVAGWEKPWYPTIGATPPSDTAGLQYGIRLGNTVRRLTPTECERLQGFPDGWTDGQSDSQRYKQMGNAVAVPVVEWVMKGIVNEQL
jgi:DNA (cytosine-5)-methyltransferase 1